MDSAIEILVSVVAFLAFSVKLVRKFSVETVPILALLHAVDMAHVSPQDRHITNTLPETFGPLNTSTGMLNIPHSVTVN
jgi:hypothetical protein